jgi:hypothetical protein
MPISAVIMRNHAPIVDHHEPSANGSIKINAPTGQPILSSVETHEFSGPQRGNALYQGTTLIGPLRPNADLGFWPLGFRFARQE